jgi:hypothetical protein
MADVYLSPTLLYQGQGVGSQNSNRKVLNRAIHNILTPFTSLYLKTGENILLIMRLLWVGKKRGKKMGLILGKNVWIKKG